MKRHRKKYRKDGLLNAPKKKHRRIYKSNHNQRRFQLPTRAICQHCGKSFNRFSCGCYFEEETSFLGETIDEVRVCPRCVKAENDYYENLINEEIAREKALGLVAEEPF